MSLTADAGTIEVTDEMLEQFFADEDVCDAEECSKPAKYLITAVPCGHQVRNCRLHMLREVKSFELDRPDAVCHLNTDLKVQELKVTEL